MNSPYPITSSPLSHICLTFARTRAKLGASSKRAKRPSSRTTHGPSVSSEGVMAHAFPGRSIFICVPMVMKSSKASIEAVLVEAAAKPDGRARPYLSRNPPACNGPPNTGRPAMMSFMNFVMGGTFLDLKTSPSSVCFSFPREANLEIKSHPGTLSRSVCF